MNQVHFPVARGSVPRQSQRGVVLFVALIGMVVLSLAAVALLRSVDSGTSIAGNLAFKQASIGPVNYAVEQAAYNLFVAPAAQRIPNGAENHWPALNYYANLQAGETASGIPAGIYGSGYTYPAGFTKFTDPTTGYDVRWIVERVCANPFEGDALSGDGIKACDTLIPKVGEGGTTMDLRDLRNLVQKLPLYRVSIRVDGPSNTVTYAQAMLR